MQKIPYHSSASLLAWISAVISASDVQSAQNSTVVDASSEDIAAPNAKQLTGLLTNPIVLLFVVVRVKVWEVQGSKSWRTASRSWQ
mmetsp:Transcript_53853/g.99539  ORF Transcript_53853/g.99539 Transcript_53853/m.99539 type:complete len:86 (+) Transcript_53853:556-813(+)